MKTKPNIYHEEPSKTFAFACPVLLDFDYNDPYSEVEDFFAVKELSDRRKDLNDWYQFALNKEAYHDKPNQLLAIHNQFIKLITAGFLIAKNGLPYKPKLHVAHRGMTWGHFYLRAIIRTNQTDLGVQFLSAKHQIQPMAFLQREMTVETVSTLRTCMNVWFEAALTKRGSIAELCSVHTFDQCRKLHKIMEALYLLILEPAISELINEA